MLRDMRHTGIVGWRCSKPNRKYFVRIIILDHSHRMGIVAYFADPNNIRVLREILKEVTLVVEENTAPQDLEGKTFVITGSLNHFANRDELKKLIEDRGGKVAGSVSSKTTYLINNDVLSSSSKNKKAKSLGIPIISEDDFLQL